MKINLRGLILNLTKKNEEIVKSSAIPGKLNKLEKEMKAGTVTAVVVMERLRREEKLQSVFSEREWNMIESEVKKMIK